MNQRQIEKLAVVLELYGPKNMSEAAKKVFVTILSNYPSEKLDKALEAAVLGVKGKLTPAAIIDLMPRQRPEREVCRMLPGETRRTPAQKDAIEQEKKKCFEAIKKLYESTKLPEGE